MHWGIGGNKTALMYTSHQLQNWYTSKGTFSCIDKYSDQPVYPCNQIKVYVLRLSFTTLWAISADDKLTVVYLFIQENMLKRRFLFCIFLCVVVFHMLRLCLVIICSSSVLRLVPRKICASWLGHSLGSFHYENTPIQIYWKFQTRNWNFSDKNSNIFHISAQNIDCRLFLSRNKKTNVYPCKARFYYLKVGFKGVKII